MATHSSVLAWRIPGMVGPGGLPSMGLHRVGHDWSDLAGAAAAATVLCVLLPIWTLRWLYNISGCLDCSLNEPEDHLSGTQIPDSQISHPCCCFLLFLNGWMQYFFFFLVALSLCCYIQAFSSCSGRRLLSCRAQTYHCGGFSCCRARAQKLWHSA